MTIYNAADLPTTSNQSFVAWMNDQLLASGKTTPTNNLGHDSEGGKGKESILNILWCYAEQLSEPGVLFPCCALLTEKKIFIERLVNLESSFPGVPEMEPCSILPIQNIQQIVVGQCNAFVQLEEAFVGKSGTFTLFSIEPQGVKRFVKNTFDACSILNVMNTPDCIDLSVQSDLLKTIAKQEEQNFAVVSDRLATTILVRLKGYQSFMLLVLSENKVYCLDIALAHWPPASFETSPEEAIAFNVVHEFSIMDKISNIKFHASQEQQDGSRERRSSSDELSGMPNFIHYDLSLEVALSSQGPDYGWKISMVESSQQQHSTCITYLFTSAASRDLFLDRLTNLRAELAHRMSPNIREEPEGGNEQAPLTDGHAFKSWSSSPKFIPSPSYSVESLVSSGSLLSRPQNIANNSKASRQHLRKSPASQPTLGSYDSDSQKDCKFISESVVSDKSLGVVSLMESDVYNESIPHYQTPTSSTAYYSTSPRDDLSVSPMSNFSRASISPPVGQEPDKKGRMFYSSGAVGSPYTQQTSVFKADSLPSSFDWKQYYFKSPPNFPVLNTCQPTDQSVQTSQTLPQCNESTVQVEIHPKIPERVLEDIESSSEFESSQVMETDHELYLKQCVKSYDLFHPLPTKLKPLCLMNGRELRQFFHSMIAVTLSRDNGGTGGGGGGLAEELHYVVWCSVVPYTNPKHEICTLVMLSTYGVYLVSDTRPKAAHKSRPSWMTHSRNQSDSAITYKTEISDALGYRKTVKPYFVFTFKDLQQVNIGLFDQCVRLTGSNENSVFTLATRDSFVTETFIQKLKYVLSLIVSSPMVEKNKLELEQDFYHSSQRTKSTLEGIVYTHPSQISFVYPGEDAVKDILYLVNERAYFGAKVLSYGDNSAKLWLYMQCYMLPLDDRAGQERNIPRSIIITSTHFCLAEEDIVTYPLPDFVRGLPENPCHEIVECRRIESLKRITQYHGHPHWVSLSFLDEPEELVVDVSIEHFSHKKTGKKHHSLKSLPEINYRLFVQNVKERDKMVKVVDKLWKELVSQVGRILDINKI